MKKVNLLRLVLQDSGYQESRRQLKMAQLRLLSDSQETRRIEKINRFMHQVKAWK